MTNTPPPPITDIRLNSEEMRILFETMRGFTDKVALSKHHIDLLIDQIELCSRDCHAFVTTSKQSFLADDIYHDVQDDHDERSEAMHNHHQCQKVPLFLVHSDPKTITDLSSGYVRTGYFAVYPFLHLHHLIPRIVPETNGVIFLSSQEVDEHSEDLISSIRQINPYIPVIILTPPGAVWKDSGAEHTWIDGTVCEQEIPAKIIKSILNGFETVTFRRSGIDYPDNPSHVMKGGI